jgi:hypothetical protein
MALQSRGDIEEGVRLIEKALEMDELCEFAYETLGTIGQDFIICLIPFRYLLIFIRKTGQCITFFF